jgi:protein-arginine deiminase
MLRRRVWLPAAAGLVAACSSDLGTPPSESAVPEPDLLADLRADSNRDGEIRFDDSDKNKTEWNKTTGAVFLANIDDDNVRCKANLDDLTIAECNDASDEIIDGEDDALDVARLKTRPWPKTPEDAIGIVTVEPPNAQDHVRLFWKSGPAVTDFLPVMGDTFFTREEIQAGIELGIEAKDIVRDPAKWDGYVDVRFTVTSVKKGTASEVVRMRVAPVLTYHHLLPAEKVWVSDTGRPGNAEMRKGLAESCAAASVAEPQTIDVNDPWAQDFFEPAFMSMPGPNGTQHVMRVNYRSANVFEPKQQKRPLRPAGQFVFKMRGKDVAGVQQYDLKHDPRMDSLNSFGNFETIPPYEKDGQVFPLGRVLRGSTRSFFPDKTFASMVDAQGQQPAVNVDTSWLVVGHVDETLSFVRASTPRGWKLLVNDARMAKKMLEDQVAAGHGDVPMFVGKSWVDLETGEERPAEVTIAKVLADTEVMRASAEAAVEVDAQLAILKSEIGLTDDEIIRVPFLHTTYAGKSEAYQPGTVNGIYVSETRFAAPDPHGPVIDGKDIFKTALSEPLAQLGITVDFVEDWEEYHLGIGEVHCGSNTTRKIPDIKWWESGR